jgi:orotate phosphoribosyltransferase
MNRTELAESIYNISHLTGEFLLRSGKISNEYFDKYRFESKPDILKAIANEMSKLLPNDFDYLAGLEMGGIPIATAISFASSKPAVFVRKKAKQYGTCKLAEGTEIEGKKLIIIEDVITSGGQVIISTNELKALGAEIETVICVIDREQGGREALEAAGLKLKSLFTMTELKASNLI